MSVVKKAPRVLRWYFNAQLSKIISKEALKGVWKLSVAIPAHTFLVMRFLDFVRRTIEGFWRRSVFKSALKMYPRPKTSALEK